MPLNHISQVFKAGVPIFVEHWGDNLQFYPNFALFSTLGGINLDHDFFQLSKLSEDQKKRSLQNMEDLSLSEFRWRSKQKKGLHQKWSTFFLRILVETCAQMHIKVKLLGGCRCGPSSNYWGDISPPGFGTSGSKPFESTRILTFESQLKKLNCLILVFLAI